MAPLKRKRFPGGVSNDGTGEASRVNAQNNTLFDNEMDIYKGHVKH
jgi:hypothetical protein